MRYPRVIGFMGLTVAILMVASCTAPQTTTPAAQPTTGAAAQASPTAAMKAAPTTAPATATTRPTAQASPGAMPSPSVAGATPMAVPRTPGAAAMPAPTFGKISGTVRIMGVWGGEELDSFRAVAAEWERMTGGRVEFEGTRDLSPVLTARVQGGNPPDLAILPNPALMTTFARRNSLKPLGQVLDMNRLRNDYSQAWIELGTVSGQLYGLFIKGAPKNTVWYSPTQFSQNSWQVPRAWDDLIRLSDQMVAAGKAPWSIGMESAAASGWPGSDWLQELYLREHGPEMYDKWVRHEIPWTDPSVKATFERFGQIALKQGYVSGGVQNVLATNFTDASFAPFMDPPRAQMYFLGAFTQGFITKQFPNLQAGQEYDFFPFPTINSQYEGAVTGGADIAVMFNDNEASRSFMSFMAWAKAWEPWAKKGGFTSPNRSFDPAVYTDPITAKAARQLTDARIFRFDADDLMPAEVQQAEWKAILAYMGAPNTLDSILQGVEAIAKTAYTP